LGVPLFSETSICQNEKTKTAYPSGPKIINLMAFPIKASILVEIYNQQFQGTIVVMVFDFQGICVFEKKTAYLNSKKNLPSMKQKNSSDPKHRPSKGCPPRMASRP